MRQQGGNGRVWLVLLAVVALSAVVAAAYLGPERAWRIARAAALAELMDGLHDPPRAMDGLPVLRIERPRPGSGTVLRDGPVRVPVIVNTVFDETLYHLDALPVLLSLEHTTPTIPVKELMLDRDGVVDLVDRYLELRLAAACGVAAAWSMPAWVTYEGARPRLMWLRERVTPDFLADRRLGVDMATVYRLTHADHAAWMDAEAWTEEGDGQLSVTTSFRELLGIIGSPELPAMDRRDGLLAHVDVEAWLRYDAALEAMDRAPEAVVMLHDPRQGKWLPVLEGLRPALRDSLGMRLPDPLLRQLLSEPDLRHRRDELLRECRILIQSDRPEAMRMSLLHAIRPALLRDRYKLGRVLAGDDHLYRVPLRDVLEQLAAHSIISAQQRNAP